MTIHHSCSGHSPFADRPLQAGFTLIEILLVITLIAVSTAMIAPSFISLSGGDVDEEARRMQQILRLSAEEAQLTGTPIRLVAMKNGYRFEQLNDKQTWTALRESPFAAHDFSQGIEIVGIQFSGNVSPEGMAKEEDSRDEKPVGYLVFWPDGMLDAADITIGSFDAKQELSLQVRSGPGGIRLADQESS